MRALGLLALASLAAAGTADLVDGRALRDVALVSAGPAGFEFRDADGEVTRTPSSRVVSVVLDATSDAVSPDPFNLYLLDGDRLRGAVHGEGGNLSLEGVGIERYSVPLARVRAVRFGRLVGALQSRYAEVFARELARGRDVVLVQRGTRPFPIAARVLLVGATSLALRVGDDRREVEIAKVYGFVRAGEAPDPEAAGGGLRLRLFLRGGGRVTLPLGRVTRDAVEAPGARILRGVVHRESGREETVPFLRRLEVRGPHLAQMSALDPIDVTQVALFGEPPAWRRNAMVHGGPLRIAGRSYDSGLGVAAYSRLEFALGGRWKSFFVRCGIDDAAGPEGDALFRVLGDSKTLAEVRCRRGERARPLALAVDGVDRLTLEVQPGDSYVSDFCDWADARVFNPGAE